MFVPRSVVVEDPLTSVSVKALHVYVHVNAQQRVYNSCNMLKLVHTSQTIMRSKLIFTDVNNLKDVRLTYGDSGLLKMLNYCVLPQFVSDVHTYIQWRCNEYTLSSL